MGQKRTLTDFFAGSTNAVRSEDVGSHSNDLDADYSDSSVKKTRAIQASELSTSDSRLCYTTNAAGKAAFSAGSNIEEKGEAETDRDSSPPSQHPSYPFAIPGLPRSLDERLCFCPATEGTNIVNRPLLDLVYWTPYIETSAAQQLFKFLRRELPFYRVQYRIKRGSVETNIKTPRWTTVFGVDSTSFFSSVPADQEHEHEHKPSEEKDNPVPMRDGRQLLDAQTHQPVPASAYKHTPRPIPACLDRLRQLVEGSTGERFNFVLVNYYASGTDSISYHSDDERFLGKDPAIASLSLGAERDFYMKPKLAPAGAGKGGDQALKDSVVKFKLSTGAMVLMRGPTQANWLHAIPKRAGEAVSKARDTGRINITFRRAVVKGGTENYYRYNVRGDEEGPGQPFRWDEARREMVLWDPKRSGK